MNLSYLFIRALLYYLLGGELNKHKKVAVAARYLFKYNFPPPTEEVDEGSKVLGHR